jgi:hypothetical protein
MKVTRHDIGGELISIITKGMYADPKDALREYVQNGVDANAENILIKIKFNSIVIADDGHGMDKVIMRRAVRVGISVEIMMNETTPFRRKLTHCFGAN